MKLNALSEYARPKAVGRSTHEPQRRASVDCEREYAPRRRLGRASLFLHRHANGHWHTHGHGPRRHAAPTSIPLAAAAAATRAAAQPGERTVRIRRRGVVCGWFDRRTQARGGG